MLLSKTLQTQKPPLKENDKKEKSKLTKIIYTITKIYLHQNNFLQQIRLGQTAADGGRFDMPKQQFKSKTLI